MLNDLLSFFHAGAAGWSREKVKAISLNVDSGFRGFVVLWNEASYTPNREKQENGFAKKENALTNSLLKWLWEDGLLS